MNSSGWSEVFQPISLPSSRDSWNCWLALIRTLLSQQKQPMIQNLASSIWSSGQHFWFLQQHFSLSTLLVLLRDSLMHSTKDMKHGDLSLARCSLPCGWFFISIHSLKVWWVAKTEHQPLLFCGQCCWPLSSLLSGSRLIHSLTKLTTPWLVKPAFL